MYSPHVLDQILENVVESYMVYCDNISFHLKSPQKSAKLNGSTQILMKVHTYGPCNPNKKNPIFFLIWPLISRFMALSNFYENVNFRVKGLFKNPQCAQNI